MNQVINEDLIKNINQSKILNFTLKSKHLILLFNCLKEQSFEMFLFEDISRPFTYIFVTIKNLELQKVESFQHSDFDLEEWKRLKNI